MRRLHIVVAALLCPLAAVAGQAEWVVDRKPILDVPGVAASGTVNFENFVGATRLKDGSLLIADRGANSIRLIDPSGKLVRTSGRTGDGPGEFQTMLWAGRCGLDSMLVWDMRKGQASLVGASGAVARQFKIPADSAIRVRRPINVIGCGSRTIAYISEPTGNAPTAVKEIMSMLASAVTVSREGKVVGHVDSLASGEWYAVVSPSGGHGAFPRPLGVTPFVTLVGDRAIIGLTDSARVMIVEPDGKRTTVGVPVLPRAPTREEFDAAVSSIAAMAPPQMRESAVGQLSKAPLPTLAPAFSGLFSDPLGLVWVQTSALSAKQPMFLVMQPDGRVVSRVIVPVALTVSEIGADYILGSYTDANDEPHVVVLRLSRK
jgi:hypothetical protein